MRLNQRGSRIAGSRWLRVYPRAWRDRYEAELLALLEARPPDRRARIDLARGALDAHLHPLTPPPFPVVSAVVAGVAWIVAGLASAAQPTAPDWPGFLLETLPIGLIGALAAFRVVMAVGRRSGLGSPRGSDVAFAIAIVGHVAWIVALAMAIVGGPYGAVTGAGQSMAAVGTVAVGVVRWRADDHPMAEAVIVAGGALLIPTPVAWLIVGSGWIALALVALRPALPMRRA
jgi:hypothetical protein